MPRMMLSFCIIVLVISVDKEVLAAGADSITDADIEKYLNTYLDERE